MGLQSSEPAARSSPAGLAGLGPHTPGSLAARRRSGSILKSAFQILKPGWAPQERELAAHFFSALSDSLEGWAHWATGRGWDVGASHPLRVRVGDFC
jgi:hypothetical protein